MSAKYETGENGYPVLTPTEDLFIEVLIARHRLGENVWTFGDRQARVAKALSVKGLVIWKYGPEPKTILAFLTEHAREVYLTYPYRIPLLHSDDPQDVAVVAASAARHPGAVRAAITAAGR